MNTSELFSILENKLISYGSAAVAPLEFVFQEQSYSSLHSAWSLAWYHVCGDIDNPCGVITDFWGVIADPCGVVAIPVAIGGRRCGDPIVARLAKHC